MGMINSIRAAFPVTEALASPATSVPRTQGSHPAGTSAPVAAPILAQAVPQVPPKAATGDPQLLEAQMTVENSATAAAEAARDAYIKASIAAGISPLPLP